MTLPPGRRSLFCLQGRELSKRDLFALHALTVMLAKQSADPGYVCSCSSPASTSHLRFGPLPSCPALPGRQSNAASDARRVRTFRTPFFFSQPTPRSPVVASVPVDYLRNITEIIVEDLATCKRARLDKRAHREAGEALDVKASPVGSLSSCAYGLPRVMPALFATTCNARASSGRLPGPTRGPARAARHPT